MPEDITDSYLTLDAPCSQEIKIKGSRFIGLGHSVATVDDAMAILDDIRKREYAATHHCFAYTVGLESETFKYSDDGEPNGTAGRPIYNAIIGRELKNTLVVVVRYFGGTKLGTGGLTRAYTQATIEMLDKAAIVERLICDRLNFTIPFTYYDRLMRIIHAGNFEIIKQDFAEDVALTIDIRKSRTEAFREQLTEMTGGQIDITADH